MSEKRKRINTANLLREKQRLIEGIKSKLNEETPSAPVPVRSDDETELTLQPDFSEVVLDDSPVVIITPEGNDDPVIVTQTPDAEEPASSEKEPDPKEETPAAPAAPAAPKAEEKPPLIRIPPPEKERHSPTPPVSAKDETAPAEQTGDPMKRLIGKWTVISHTTSGDDFRMYFEMSHLNGGRFKTVTISETFSFRDHTCIKETDIEGVLDDGQQYHYRLNLNTSFKVPRDGVLEITVDIGSLRIDKGNEPPSVKEYIGDGKSDETGFRFEGAKLILEDVYRDDKKVLVKLG
jgi:hypothetical protein